MFIQVLLQLLVHQFSGYLLSISSHHVDAQRDSWQRLQKYADLIVMFMEPFMGIPTCVESSTQNFQVAA